MCQVTMLSLKIKIILKCKFNTLVGSNKIFWNQNHAVLKLTSILSIKYNVI